MNIKEYWECEDTQSMSDFRVSNLESLMIAKHITSKDRLLNVGCGDGSSCHLYRDIPEKYIGFERSPMMIKRFVDKSPDIEIIQGDMKNIPDIGEFSTIVTQRSLINLETHNEQRSVLKNLCSMISEDGSLIVCEAFSEGLDRLNELRREVGLPEHQQRWHNLYLNNDVMQILESDMKLDHEEDLSGYFLMTRILHPLLVDRPSTESKFNEMSELIHPLLNIKGIGYIKLQKWVRK
jgi:ubiquinone/menaquinone biosynthesis C-methylase UbiE